MIIEKVFIAQLFGFIGLVLLVIPYMFNSRKFILKMQIAASIVFGIHYFMIGAITGSVSQVLNVVRSFVYLKEQKKWQLYIFIVLYVIIGLFTWKGLVSILAIIGSILSTIGYFMKDTRLIRIFSLLQGISWLAYCILSRSLGGTISESIFVIVVLVGIIRFDLIGRKKSEMLAEGE